MFAEESKFTGCDFNETVFKRYGVSAVFAAICQSERGVLRQVIFGRNPADGFRIERMQRCRAYSCDGGFNRDELL